MGGLSRKAQQISLLGNKDISPAILLDAGNVLFKQPVIARSQELLTASGMMNIYQQMGYDAVAVGPHDVAAGIAFLKTGQARNFPWLSANLTDKDHAPIFPGNRILQRGAMRIGVIGLTGPLPKTSRETLVADWRKVLPEHLAQVAKQCQLIIVLSSLSAEDNAEITRQYPQINLLITADLRQGNIDPQLDNKTLITQTMGQGKYLGMLNLDWIPGSSWAGTRKQEPNTSSYAGSFIALGKNIAEDPKIAARVDQIKEQIVTHNKKTAANASISNTSEDKAMAGLAGSSSCRECHPLQSGFWRSTRHSEAYTALQQQQQNFNLDCLPCHTTGNRPLPKATAPPVETLLTLPSDLQAVGCETCHGAGLAHAKSPKQIKLRGKVEEKTCVVCHTKERDPLFDYRRKIDMVSCPAG
ncbi:MAG: multiheme c-type cytochrome [Desulforhopalus sp.]|nr:multiheme c-type cytochrome [Desulforhopalus sp.]